MTQRKKAKKAQRNSLDTGDAQYRTLVENLKDYALIQMDTKGYIKNWNSGAERLLKYKKKEVLGRHIGIFFTKEDREKGIDKKEIRHALKYGRADDDRWHVRKGGARFWGSGAMFPVREKGKTMGVVKIFRDTTRKMKRERRKDDFVGIASHELRTPLSILKSSLELLIAEQDKKADASQRALLTKMNEQVDRLAILTRDLLDLSKITRGQLIPEKRDLDLPALIKDVMRNLHGISKQHDLVLRGEKKVIVPADKEQLIQILHNLLNNAVKYSPDSKRIEVNVRNKKQRVEVSIRDYGIGISESEQKKIFERFYRVRDRHEAVAGLGIGLYVCAEIVKAHHGLIGVKSEKGKGSTFYFTLPKRVGVR